MPSLEYLFDWIFASFHQQSWSTYTWGKIGMSLANVFWKQEYELLQGKSQDVTNAKLLMTMTSVYAGRILDRGLVVHSKWLHAG